MLVEIDANEDGYVSFDEFVEIFQRAPDTLPFGLRSLVDLLGTASGAVGGVLAAAAGTASQAATPLVRFASDLVASAVGAPQSQTGSGASS